MKPKELIVEPRLVWCSHCQGFEIPGINHMCPDKWWEIVTRRP